MEQINQIADHVLRVLNALLGPQSQLPVQKVNIVLLGVIQSVVRSELITQIVVEYLSMHAYRVLQATGANVQVLLITDLWLVQPVTSA